MIFRKIEYFIEGDGNKQKINNGKKWTTELYVRKTIKHIVFLEDEILGITKSKINNFFKLLSFIKKNNLSKAFPIGISINEVIAHDSFHELNLKID